MTDVPHFALPFRFSTPRAAVVEQDSVDEIAGCVLAVLLCPFGFRVELPTFGVPDPTFSMPGVDVDELRAVVELWEPRASVLFEEEEREALDELQARIATYVRVRTEE